MCATLLRASIEKTFGSRHAVCLWGRSYSRRRPPYSLSLCCPKYACVLCVCSGYLYFLIFFRKKRNKDKNRGNLSNRLKWANQHSPDETIICPLRRFIMLSPPWWCRVEFYFCSLSYLPLNPYLYSQYPPSQNTIYYIHGNSDYVTFNLEHSINVRLD